MVFGRVLDPCADAAGARSGILTAAEIGQNRLWVEVADEADRLLVGQVGQNAVDAIALSALVGWPCKGVVASLLLPVVGRSR